MQRLTTPILVFALLLAMSQAMAQVPTITGFAPQKANIGASVTITGTNFSPNAPITLNNIVYFGAVRATVTSATATQLVVTVPYGASSVGPISVRNSEAELMAFSKDYFTVTYGEGQDFVNGANYSTLAPKVDFSTPIVTGRSVVQDFDLDGKPDMASVSSNGDMLYVFPNTATPGSINAGSFGAVVNYALPSFSSTEHLATGDIDGDGKTDLIVLIGHTAQSNSNTIMVFRNTSALGSISFTHVGNYATANNPNWLAVGDIDKDGKADVVVSYGIFGANNAFSILRSTSSFANVSFAARVDFNIPAGDLTQSVSLADLDGDSKPEVIITRLTTPTPYVLFFLNTSTVGAVSMANPVSLYTVASPKSLAIADLDDDGKLDLVVHSNSNSVSAMAIIRNTSTLGALSFGALSYLSAGSNSSQHLTVGDLDGDGKADLILAKGSNQQISLFRNITVSSGLIAFDDRVDFPTPDLSPNHVTVADFDLDGQPDVMYSSGTTKLSVLRNTIDYEHPETPENLAAQTGESAEIVLSWDANTEDDIEGYLIYGGTTSNPTTLLDEVSENTFTHTDLVVGTTYYYRIKAVDFARNESEYSDNVNATPLLVPSISSFSPTSGAAASIVTINGTNFNASMANNIVYFGAKRATVTSASTHQLTVTVPLGATYAPISVTNTENGLTAHTSLPFTLTFGAGQNFISTAEFNSFGPNVSHSINAVSNATTQAKKAIVQDFDGDGKLDLAAINYTFLYIYPNTMEAPGNFNEASFGNRLAYALTSGEDIRASDVDGDGKVDLVVLNGSDVTVYLNTSSLGNLSFSAPTTWAAGIASNTFNSIALGDLDRDGKPDLVLGSFFLNNVYVLLNNSSVGNIDFKPHQSFATIHSDARPSKIALSDIDGNGRLDIVLLHYYSAFLTNFTATLSIYRNTSSPGALNLSRLDLAGALNASTHEASNTLAVADFDDDGKHDVAIGNSTGISVLRNTSTGANFSFAAKSDFGFGGQMLNVADLDGDGKVDLLRANGGSVSASLALYRNTSSGEGNINFAARVETLDFGGIVPSVAVGDLDLDGQPDILLTKSTNNPTYISVLKNRVDYQAPTIPSALQLLVGNQQIQVNWQANTDEDLKEYLVYGGTSTNPTSLLATVTDTFYIHNELDNGSTYFYRIRAKDRLDNLSDYSANISASPEKDNQTITFEALENKTYGAADFELVASTSSGLEITFSSDNEEVAIIEEGQIKVLNAGSTIIRANQGGDPFFNAAPEQVQSLTVLPATLTVTANNASKVYGTSNPEFSFEYSGFVNDEDASVLTQAPNITSLADATSPVGEYEITISGASADNYVFDYVHGTLNVTPATLTVTANNASKVYGTTNPEFSFEYSGFVNDEDASVLTQAPNITSLADATSPVGEYEITVSGGTADNYVFDYVDGTLNITPATLAVTANNASKVYGTTNPEFSFEYSGFVNDEDASVLTQVPNITSLADATSPVGEYEITVSGGSADNYTFDYVSGILSITPATLTATALNASKVYGAVNPAFDIEYSGFVNGDDVSILTVAAIASAEANELSPAGNYPITVSGGVADNYNLDYVSATLTINKEVIVATADNKNTVYNEAIPELTVSYSGFVNNDNVGGLDQLPTITTEAFQGSDAGTYAISLSGGTDNNYSFDKVDGTLTIAKANQTISIEPIANKLTTDASFNIQASTNSGLVLEYAIQSGPATLEGETISLTGASGTVVVSVMQSGNNNYNMASATESFLVIDAGKLDQEITFEEIANQVYGNENLVLVATSNSALAITFEIVNGNATIDENILSINGAGTIVVRAVQAGNDEYNPANAEQIFEVSKAVLLVTAQQETITFGEAIPELTFQYSGFVNGDDEASIMEMPSIATSAIQGSDAGEYPITVSGGSATNYSFGFVDAILTIEKANQTIIIQPIANKSINDGPFDIVAEASSGLVLEYTIESGPASIVAETITLSGVVGAVTVQVSQAGNHNYNAAVESASFEVNEVEKVEQEIVFIPIEDKTYGDEAFVLEANTDSGLEVAFELLSGPAVLNGNLLSMIGAGEITVKAIQLGNEAYLPAENTQTFTVTKATLSVSTNNTTITYGDNIPTFNLLYQGFVNGDDDQSINTLPNITTTAVATSGVGVYDIVLSGGEDDNYIFEMANASLTIQQALLTVTADAKSITYGTQIPLLTYTYAGFVHGDAESVLDEKPVINTSAQNNSDAGIYSITIDGANDHNYAFAYESAELIINKANQQISFTPIDDQPTTAEPFFLVASSLSGLDLAFGITGPASINGEVIYLTGEEGEVIITINQLGNQNYNAAEEVMISFVVYDATLRENQTIVFEAIDDRMYGDQAFELVAISSAELSVTFVIQSGPASIEGNLLSINGAGTVTVRASQAGNESYNPAASVVRSFEVLKAELLVEADHQTITFGDPLPNLTYSYQGFVNEENESEIDQQPSISTGATATSNAGIYSIELSHGDDDHYSFIFQNATLTIEKANQTISANLIEDKSLDASPFAIIASSTSGLALSYSIEGPASITDNIITLDGLAGTVNVNISQEGNINYNPANHLVLSFEVIGEVEMVPQNITMSSIANKVYGDEPIPLNATASSGLPISYTLISGPATLANNILTITGAGEIIIEASQAGNETYLPAEAIQKSIHVGKAKLLVSVSDAETIFDHPLPLFIFEVSGFVLDEEESVIDQMPIINTVAIQGSGAGNYPLIAQDGEDDNYYFVYEDGMLVIQKANQVLDVVTIENQPFNAGPIDIEAFVNTDLPLSYQVINGPARINDQTITLTGELGTVQVLVSQQGTDNYNLVSTLISFQVIKAAQAISFEPIEDKTYGGSPFQLVASSSSQLKTHYQVISGPAVIENDMLTMLGAGNVIVEASQPGNEYFEAAASQSRDFKISKAILEAQADAKTIQYGDPIPELTISYSGFVNGETINVLEAKPQASTLANSSSNAGVYDITLSGGLANNYSISLVNGSLTINKADQSISIEPIADKDLNDANTPLTFTVTAIATSNLDLVYEVSGPASISDNIITLTGESGLVMLTVSQSGNINYNSAQAVESFEVMEKNKVLNIERIQNTTLHLYPNPAFESVHLEFENTSSANYQLRLINLLGEIVWSKDVFNTSKISEQINLSEYKKGMYLLQIVSGQKVQTEKLLIK